MNLSVPTGFPTCGMRLKDNDGWCFIRQPVFDLCFSLTLNCSNPISRSTRADTVLGVNMVEIFLLLRILNINCSLRKDIIAIAHSFPRAVSLVLCIFHIFSLCYVCPYLYLCKQCIIPFSVGFPKHIAMSSRFWCHLTQNTDVQTWWVSEKADEAAGGCKYWLLPARLVPHWFVDGACCVFFIWAVNMSKK